MCHVLVCRWAWDSSIAPAVLLTDVKMTWALAVGHGQGVTAHSKLFRIFTASEVVDWISPEIERNVGFDREDLMEKCAVRGHVHCPVQALAQCVVFQLEFKQHDSLQVHDVGSVTFSQSRYESVLFFRFALRSKIQLWAEPSKKSRLDSGIWFAWDEKRKKKTWNEKRSKRIQVKWFEMKQNEMKEMKMNPG